MVWVSVVFHHLHWIFPKERVRGKNKSLLSGIPSSWWEDTVHETRLRTQFDDAVRQLREFQFKKDKFFCAPLPRSDSNSGFPPHLENLEKPWNFVGQPQWEPCNCSKLLWLQYILGRYGDCNASLTHGGNVSQLVRFGTFNTTIPNSYLWLPESIQGQSPVVLTTETDSCVVQILEALDILAGPTRLLLFMQNGWQECRNVPRWIRMLCGVASLSTVSTNMTGWKTTLTTVTSCVWKRRTVLLGPTLDCRRRWGLESVRSLVFICEFDAWRIGGKISDGKQTFMPTVSCRGWIWTQTLARIWDWTLLEQTSVTWQSRTTLRCSMSTTWKELWALASLRCSWIAA